MAGKHAVCIKRIKESALGALLISVGIDFSRKVLLTILNIN